MSPKILTIPGVHNCCHSDRLQKFVATGLAKKVASSVCVEWGKGWNWIPRGETQHLVVSTTVFVSNSSILSKRTIKKKLHLSYKTFTFIPKRCQDITYFVSLCLNLFVSLRKFQLLHFTIMATPHAGNVSVQANKGAAHVGTQHDRRPETLTWTNACSASNMSGSVP